MSVGTGTIDHRRASSMVASVIAVTLFGLLVAVDPTIALAVLAVPVGLWLLLTPLRRAGTMVFGGLFTLGSVSLTTPKLIYLATMAVIVSVALVRGLSGRQHIPRSLTWTTVAVLALVVAGAVNGLMAGNDMLDVMRDSATYAALAAVGVVGADAAPWVDRRTLDRLLVTAGVVSSLGFTLEWLARRGFAALPVTDVILHSPIPGALLWCYSLGRLAGGGPRSWVWLAPAAISFGLPLLTGSRNILLYAAAPVVVAAMAAARGRWRGVFRTAVIAPVGLLLIAVLVAGSLGGAATGHLDVEAAVERLSTVGDVLNEPAADPSLEERLTQNRLAWATFTNAPVLGAGPGHIFRWDRSGPLSLTAEAFTIDTSLVIPAKYGLVGVATLLVLLVAWYRARPRSDVWRLTLGAFAALVVLLSMLGPTIEDKGLPVAVVLTLMARQQYKEGCRVGA